MGASLVMSSLLDRYDRPGPRYTSYPPIPSWSTAFGEPEYRAALAELADQPHEPVSVYVHLPFCVARCWYCGCNATVTRHDRVQESYVRRVLHELDLVLGPAGSRRPSAELHWGGGTPNFLGPAAMERLMDALLARFALR